MFSFVVLPILGVFVLLKYEKISLDAIGFSWSKKKLGSKIANNIEEAFVASIILCVIYAFIVIFGGLVVFKNINYTIEMPVLGGGYAIRFYEAITAAVYEEVYARGVLFYIIVSKLKKPTGLYVLLSGLIFSLCHWERGIHVVLATLYFGCMAAYLYKEQRTLFPLIVAHFILDILIW